MSETTTVARRTRITAAAMMAAAIAAATAAGEVQALPPGAAPPSAPNDVPGAAAANNAPGSFPTPRFEAPPIYFNPSIQAAPIGDAGTQPQAYATRYSPLPTTALRLPRPTAPVRPILPTPGYLRAGNVVVVKPKWLADTDARSINRLLAYLEAKETQALESIGVPRNDAARKSAATLAGVGIGAVSGAAAIGIPAAVVGALGGAVAGGVTGAALVPLLPVGFTAPIQIAIGTGIGAGAGALGLGIAGAVVGGVAGGVIGGAIGGALGTGDPGRSKTSPLPDVPYVAPTPPPHPEANQYQAGYKGLPGGVSVNVSYTVAKNGDVNAGGQIAGFTLPKFHLSAAQARAPFGAFGLLQDTARQAVTQAAVDLSNAAHRALPGLAIAFPQFDGTPPPSAAAPGRHRLAPKPAPRRASAPVVAAGRHHR